MKKCVLLAVVLATSVRGEGDRNWLRVLGLPLAIGAAGFVAVLGPIGVLISDGFRSTQEEVKGGMETDVYKEILAETKRKFEERTILLGDGVVSEEYRGLIRARFHEYSIADMPEILRNSPVQDHLHEALSEKMLGEMGHPTVTFEKTHDALRFQHRLVAEYGIGSNLNDNNTKFNMVTLKHGSAKQAMSILNNPDVDFNFTGSAYTPIEEGFLQPQIDEHYQKIMDENLEIGGWDNLDNLANAPNLTDFELFTEVGYSVTAYNWEAFLIGMSVLYGVLFLALIAWVIWPCFHGKRRGKQIRR